MVEAGAAEAGAPLIVLVAGEPSGDALGARLMAALRRETGGRVRFAGVGGPLMAEQGLDSLVPMRELAIMGFAEVVRHVPRVLRRIDDIVAAVRRLAPAAVVTIDAQALSLRVVRRLAGAGIPLIQYVAPTVWAWKPGRAAKLARYLDHIITLLPFEPPYFERHGLAATYVGFPAVEDVTGGDGAAFRARHGIAADVPLLCAMPGSRRGEIARLFPVFRETVRLLAARVPGLHVVIPVVANVADLVEQASRGFPAPLTLSRDTAERRDVFAAVDAALVKSGTTSVELAVAGVPVVVTHKVSVLSAAIFIMVRRVRLVSIVNIMAGRMVQPELLQANCRPRRLAKAVAHLLQDESARREQRDVGAEVGRQLGLGGTAPSVLAARAVLAHIANRATPAGA